jgi:hypothetical protein
MEALHFWHSIKSRDHRLAWTVAFAVDAIQIVAMPLFAPGALSPADTLLDVFASVILCRLLGWHWALLPTLLVELCPGLDLFPTWTAAVFFITRRSIASSEPEVLPPGPAPPPRPRD